MTKCALTALWLVGSISATIASPWSKDIEDIRQEYPAVYHEYGKLWRAGIERAKSIKDEADAATRYHAFVTQIEPLNDGALRVHFQEGDVWHVVPLAEQKSWTLDWTDLDKPVPIGEHFEVELAVDSDGQVSGFDTHFNEYCAVRRRPDGLLELILSFNSSAMSPKPAYARFHYIRVVPTYTDLQMAAEGAIYWRRAAGTLVTFGRWNGVDSSQEVESASLKNLGMPLDNDPGKRVWVGRDGWVPFKNLPETDATGGYEDLIPEQQYGSMNPPDPGWHAVDLYQRGETLRKGEGVAKNVTQAFDYFVRAAELGYAVAQHRVGVCYALGEGVQKNEEKAVGWYRRAADQGFAEAQYDLGVRYILGKGVTEDVKAGIELFQKAADQGYQEAIDALREPSLKNSPPLEKQRDKP
jgi:Sel1 repeat-containing protein